MFCQFLLVSLSFEVWLTYIYLFLNTIPQLLSLCLLIQSDHQGHKRATCGTVSIACFSLLLLVFAMPVAEPSSFPPNEQQVKTPRYRCLTAKRAFIPKSEARRWENKPQVAGRVRGFGYVCAKELMKRGRLRHREV